MAKWRIVQHVKGDPSSVRYVGPELRRKSEAVDAMREIATRTPTDPLGRTLTYRLSKLG